MHLATSVAGNLLLGAKECYSEGLPASACVALENIKWYTLGSAVYTARLWRYQRLQSGTAGTGAATAGKEEEAEEPGSAVKRRRRSSDRDVSSAGASPTEANTEGQDNASIKAEPINGAAVDGNGAVKPEAAFWSALEDSKDEVCCTA